MFSVVCRTARAADDSLDTTFGSGGKVVTDFNNSTDWLSSIAVQPDGKIVAIGDIHPSNKYALARYNPDGTLDATFGNGGKVMTVIANVRESAAGLLILPDGKILISGSIELPSASDSSFALLRYNSDGSLDTTFGNGGIVTTNVGPDDDQAYRLALQSDGKIIAAGRRGIYFNPTEQRKGNVALARYNPDGTLDTTFGNGGKVVTDFGQGLESYAIALIIQPDGRIVIAGESGYEFLVARYNPNGILDATFGNGGFSLANFSSNWDRASDAVLQSDGKIIVVGSAEVHSPYDNFALARYNPDGSFDQSFGNGGKILMSTDGEINAAVLQSDGKIIALGTSNSTFLLLRLNVNGSLDTTFGSNGTVTTSFGANTAEGNDLVLQPDGKLLAAGFTPGAPYYQNSDFALARYLNTATAVSHPTQFDFDGDSKADISVFRNRMWYLNRSSAGYSAFQFGLNSDQIVPADFDGDGKTDIAVFRPSEGNWYWLGSNGTYSIAHFGVSGDIPVVADYDGDGRADYAVYREGVWYIQRSTAGFLATQFGLASDKPVPADYDGDGKADIAVYRAGTWYVQKSSGGTIIRQFGLSTDMPVVCDYDGDGKADIAVWRPETGVWHYLESSNGNYYSYQFGANGDMPAPGDYDGDGKADLTIYRGGEWWIWRSRTNDYSVQQFGNRGDKPIPSAYIQ
ncbi:MAG TPA: FG-GAP-like repeat-containing protein [Pyrinomonadaceae bacterium]